jgi:hypothetical protein
MDGASPTASRLLLAVICLTLLSLPPAQANQTDSPRWTSVPPVRATGETLIPRGLTIEDRRSTACGSIPDSRSKILDSRFHRASLPEFHSDLLGKEAVAFFFPPVTVPPRPVPEPPPPVIPHLPPPGNPPPPVDHAPEPATLISSALGAGILALYSLRRRARQRASA